MRALLFTVLLLLISISSARRSRAPLTLPEKCERKTIFGSFDDSNTNKATKYTRGKISTRGGLANFEMEKADEVCNCGDLKMNRPRILIILDETGSMIPNKMAVISGFNTLLANLKGKFGTDSKTKLTVIKFDEKISILSSNLDDFQPLVNTENSYYPDRNGPTALYDALGCSLEAYKAENNNHLVVITDGEDNASRIVKANNVKPIVVDMASNHGWILSYIYIGEKDAAYMANEIGFPNSVNFAATAEGIADVFRTVEDTVDNLRVDDQGKEESCKRAIKHGAFADAELYGATSGSSKAKKFPGMSKMKKAGSLEDQDCCEKLERIVIILDETGSMIPHKTAAINAFNGFLADIQSAAANSKHDPVLTVVKFDEDIFILNNKLSKFASLDGTEDSYYPDRNGPTALFDAIGCTLTAYLEDENNQMIIITDGEDNVSRIFEDTEIKNLVHQTKNSNNWNIDYIYIGKKGARRNKQRQTVRYAKGLGVGADHISSFNDDDNGVNGAFKQMTKSIQMSFQPDDTMITRARVDYVTKADIPKVTDAPKTSVKKRRRRRRKNRRNRNKGNSFELFD